jgi:hypothetical protein
VSRASRRKGDRGEREIRDLLPGSIRVGYLGVEGPDLTWRGRDVEVKRRKEGWKQVYRWLEDAQLLVFRADRCEWLVALRLDELLDLLDEERAS